MKNIIESSYCTRFHRTQIFYFALTRDIFTSPCSMPTCTEPNCQFENSRFSYCKSLMVKILLTFKWVILFFNRSFRCQGQKGALWFNIPHSLKNILCRLQQVLLLPITCSAEVCWHCMVSIVYNQWFSMGVPWHNTMPQDSLGLPRNFQDFVTLLVKEINIILLNIYFEEGIRETQ